WTYAKKTNGNPAGTVDVTMSLPAGATRYQIASFLGQARQVSLSGSNVQLFDPTTNQDVTALELAPSSPWGASWTYSIGGQKNINVQARGKTMAQVPLGNFMDVEEFFLSLAPSGGRPGWNVRVQLAAGLGVVHWDEQVI